MTDFIPYTQTRLPIETMRGQAEEFFQLLNARRSVRHFSAEPVPRDLIEQAIRTASTAPSGAHRQPWRFVAVSNSQLKRQIREATEVEEQEFYNGDNTPVDWREAVRPMGTTASKPYLETVPWIVVLFAETYRQDEAQGPGKSSIEKNYYVRESVGIACGLFIAAIHNMGLATLTHTPNPMDFLSVILQRPSNERPFVLFPIGYPAPDATVPNLERKPLAEVSEWFES